MHAVWVRVFFREPTVRDGDAAEVALEPRTPLTLTYQRLEVRVVSQVLLQLTHWDERIRRRILSAREPLAALMQLDEVLRAHEGHVGLLTEFHERVAPIA